MILRIFYFFSSFVRKLVILLYHQIDRFHVSSDKSKGIYSISRCFSSFFPSFVVLHVSFLDARLFLLIQRLQLLILPLFMQMRPLLMRSAPVVISHYHRWNLEKNIFSTARPKLKYLIYHEYFNIYRQLKEQNMLMIAKLKVFISKPMLHLMKRRQFRS